MRKLLLLFVLIPVMSFAKNSPQGVEFQEYTLDNGLHVILSQDHTTPNVVVSVMYHVGSKNEEPHLTGFAHFFEHLMFEGTKHIPRHTYDKYVSRVGGTLNANTSNDRTYYYEVIPSNELALGLWLESERMLHPIIEEIGVKTQKDVVCQEMNQTRDNKPYGLLLTASLKNAFKVHPYKTDVLGSEEHVRNASVEDFKEFHDMFYVPNNAVLTICGDFEIDEAKELVSTYFSDIPKGTTEIRRPDPNMEPARTAPIKDTIFDNIQLPMLVNVYPAPAMGTKDYFAVTMLGKLLTEGETSIMKSTLVDEEQIALEVQAVALPFEHPGMNIVLGLPNMGKKVEDLEARVDATIAQLKVDGISDKDFQKLKNQVESGMVLSNSGIENKAHNLATAYTYFKNTNYINEELGKYMEVTKEDLMDAAEKYFNPNQKVSVYFLPKK